MPTQREQLEATFRARLQPRPSPEAPLTAEKGEQAGRRMDPDLFTLAIDRIRPDKDQVRRMNKDRSDPEVKELAESIRSVGLLQPIDVRYIQEGDYFEIVAGERRFTAAKLIGLDRVPVKRLYVDDSQVRQLQLIENLHRADLSPLELGSALEELMAAGATPQDLEKLLSKSKSYITKALGIARNLSEEAKQKINHAPERFQSMAHLYEVSQLPADQQDLVLLKIADGGLTRTELQSIIADLKKQARNKTLSQGGRPVKGQAFTKTITVDEATVTVRIPKVRVHDQEVIDVLRKALRTLTK